MDVMYIMYFGREAQKSFVVDHNLVDQIKPTCARFGTDTNEMAG
jgi:hypothetical protein